MKFQDNIMLNTDSYKFSHYKQYPADTEEVYSYLESRGGDYPITCFFGLQYYIKRYLMGQVVTQEKIDYAEKRVNAHIGPGTFNREGWEHILNAHGGKLPVEIKAVPEGTNVNYKNVLLTIRSTDPQCFWLVNYLETLLVKLWASITVCSNSKVCRDTYLEFLEATGTPEAVDFKVHDFGDRGVSSVETAAILGAAHLVQSMGTDTFEAIELLNEYYGEEMAGFSIAASEHSTITSWGQADEAAAMENMLDQYPEQIVACVSDSFDIINACKNIWGKKLKDKVLARKPEHFLVVRPDSGDPVEMVLAVLNALGDAFGYDVNEKGYKVLPPQVRVIQGDGIDRHSMRSILTEMKNNRWSADNLAMGSGGALLQMFNRDTNKFAFKCCNVVRNGEDFAVYKDPVTDPGKKSKRGRLKLVKVRGWKDDDPNNERYETLTDSDPAYDNAKDELITVFKDGELLVDYTLGEIRERARVNLK